MTNATLTIVDVDIVAETELIPHEYDPVKRAIQLTCVCVGIPFNIFVGAVLAYNPSLYSSRNMTWLGIIFSNLLVLILGMVEILAVTLNNHVACQIFTVSMGKPYTLVLINMLLATCDRYIYTRWSEWHDKHVTVFRAILMELISIIVVPVLLATPFWTHPAPIRCGYDLRANKLVVFVIPPLVMLCIVSKIVVYCQLRKQKTSLRNGIVSREIPINRLPSTGTFKQSRELEPLEIPQEWNSSVNTRPSAQRAANASAMIAHYNSRNHRRREMEATTSLVAGLVPLCICIVPEVLWLVWVTLCKNVAIDCQKFTSVSVRVTFYVRDLVYVHVCTNILVLVIFSKEFKKAVASNFNGIRRYFRR